MLFVSFGWASWPITRLYDVSSINHELVSALPMSVVHDLLCRAHGSVQDEFNYSNKSWAWTISLELCRRAHGSKSTNNQKLNAWCVVVHKLCVHISNKMSSQLMMSLLKGNVYEIHALCRPMALMKWVHNQWWACFIVVHEFFKRDLSQCTRLKWNKFDITGELAS